MAQELDDLFSGSLDSKMDFLNEKKQVNADGIYRIDLSKAKDKKKGYRSVVRFLPNLTKEGKVGQLAVEKVTHYVDIKNAKELSGWFDSAKNFNEKCALTDLYYTMMNSKNAILQEKAKCLKYSKKYYSYVLIIEDEQQPELVGKVMIFQYGKTIKDKIQAEKNGEISGVSCNVFDLSAGKDFVLSVKEIQTGDEIYPDYKNSAFKPETSSLPIYVEGKGFKNVPLVNGKIDPKAQSMVKDFLLKRDHELEEFAPKRLTEEQQAKINEITAYLTGKASASFKKEAVASSDDFDFEETTTASTSTASGDSDDDDFFKDF
jgi:gp32 DNA binding protein like